MFGEHFQGAIHTRLTAEHLRAADASCRRMPAFFDDVGWRRFREHVPEYIRDKTLPRHDEALCMIVSMSAKAGNVQDEIVKRRLHIYSSALLPSDDESRRITKSNQLLGQFCDRNDICCWRRPNGAPRGAEGGSVAVAQTMRNSWTFV